MTARGLVAAAGRSLRMGSPKALLKIEGEAFVTRLARVFGESGLAPVVVTVPPGADGERIGALAVQQGARVCANAYDDEGLFGSVRTAIEDAGDDDVLVVTPIDAPFATVTLVRALVSAVDDAHDAAVVVARDEHGHPVAVRVRALRAFLIDGRAHGLTRVLDRLGPRVREIPCDDARVTMNINTREELLRVTTPIR